MGETSLMRACESKLIVNLSRGDVVCERGCVAEKPLLRMRGLLGKSAIGNGEGMLLRPAPSIHTAFMRFPIDAVFLDRDLRIVKLVRNLEPWHMASARRATAVLEIAAGESERRGLELDHRLAVLDPPPPPAPSVSPTVLLVGDDRRFRSVVSLLLTRRGYRALVADPGQDIVDGVARGEVEVVVIDATSSLTQAAHESARLQEACPAVGVVVVSDDPRHTLESLPVVRKWGGFVSLFEAIEDARRSPAVGG
jgi:uncharacterized membrane protein (UPF0127 family)